MSGPAPGQERLVVSRLRFLGDVVLSTPVLAAVREARPDAWIDYVVNTPFAPALAHHPCVDRVLTLPMKAGPRDTWALMRRLRKPTVDWYFDLLSNPRSALHVLASRPRRSVGQEAGPRSWVYTFRRPRPQESQVRGHLDKLVPMLGVCEERRPRLYVTPQERSAIAAQFDLDGERPSVILHPGATWPWRLWPSEAWSMLIASLGRALPRARLLVVTPPGVQERRIASLTEGGRATALPVLSLRSLLALLSHASAYVGNDGGVLHAAVALGVPTVGLFGGENDPAEWFPYERFGPYRAILRSSAETFRDGKGRRFPRPDARPEEVLESVLEVLAQGWDRDDR